mgnify:CR=1 FL=1
MARKLPIGIQSFEKIRTGGFMYIDKTDLIYQLASSKSPYFLSRPRRFGKSLLMSTLEAYFLGKKELFTGLAMETLETEWKEYPVLHLDLNARNYDSKEALIAILNQHLEKWEAKYGDEKKERSPEERFSYLLERIHEASGSQVVILIDEYDKPLLQTIGNEKLQDQYKNILKAFYGVLKSADAHLRFVFLTGVTKFGQISVFSDLNQLKDISMDARYATICGITDKELRRDFQPELEALAANEGLSYEEVCQKMKRMYDGYHFRHNMEGLYNPFSVLNALDSVEFGSYWFSTGTPTFLVQLLKETDYDLRNLEGIELPASQFADYRADADYPIPVIYQSGYLTIKGYDKEFQSYTLGFPNEEVKYGFLNFLVPYYTGVSSNENLFNIRHSVNELRSGDANAFLTRLRAFFAGIPYELNDKTERHYQAIFYLVFRLLGQYMEVEERSAKGRADAVVKTKDYVYVFEFKLDGNVDEALKQIDEKGYLLPYSADQRQLMKIGVSFDSAERNIGEWKMVK